MITAQEKITSDIPVLVSEACGASENKPLNFFKTATP
jgi:hypothetical protein